VAWRRHHQRPTQRDDAEAVGEAQIKLVIER
jgi:hypothetical protein